MAIMFRAELETFLARYPVTPTQLGLLALGDRSFVSRVLGGRSPRLCTAERVQAWMSDYVRRNDPDALKGASVLASEHPALYSLKFRLPIVTPLLNETLRLHHRELKRQQLAMAWEVKAATAGRAPSVPLARARVTIERHSIGTPDQDNLVGGAKQLVDILIRPQPLPAKKPGAKSRVRHAMGLSFIVDDGPDVLEAVYRAVRVAKRDLCCTIVTIEELPPRAV